MHIHILKKDETVSDVAQKYGVSPESIERNNGLVGKVPAVGEELLILTPTRTYTVKRGDTPERLSLRFGVRSCDIATLNPWVHTEGLVPGRKIALKYDERIHGMAAANGYFYEGCDKNALKMALPYLTYVTFASAVAHDGGIKYTFRADDTVAAVKEANKIPLLRIYDRARERNYTDKVARSSFIESIIKTAADGGWRGVVMCGGNNKAVGFADFLVELRGKMIGYDLILLAELDEESPAELGEYTDGNVLCYAKYALDNPPSFADGERRVYSDFACNSESAKTFIELPAFARVADGYTDIESCLDTARRAGISVEHDEYTLLSHFINKRQALYTYTSLKNIKATLDLLAEFGFMGISFDIMRTPVAYLMMYNAMFKTAGFSGARAREGCSRES